MGPERLIEIKRGIAAFVSQELPIMWLLAGYVLPATIFERLSARGCLFCIFGNWPLHRICVAVGICFLVAWAWNALRGGCYRWGQALWWLILIYTIPYLVDVFRVTQSVDALTRFTDLLSAMTLGLIAGGIHVRPERSLRALGLLGSLQAVYSLLYFITGHNIWHTRHVIRAGGTFNQPESLYCVMLLCLPISVSLAFANGRQGHRRFWLVCSLLIFTALVLTLTRGGILAAGVTLVWLSFRLQWYRRVKVQLTLAMCAVLMSGVLFRSLTGLNRLAIDWEYRYNIWCMAWGLFCHHPWFGVGVDQVTLPVHEIRNGKSILLEFGAPENLYLHWLCERGVFGAMLLLLFVVYGAKAITRTPSLWRTAVTASFLGILVAGLFDTPFGRAEYAATTILVLFLITMTGQLAIRNGFNSSGDPNIQRHCEMANS